MQTIEAERKEILALLAEGRVTVDEAERLLNALGEGKRESRAEKEARKEGGGVQEALNAVKETLAGLGPFVGRMVGEISTEFQKDRNYPGETEAEELPEIELNGGRFPVEAGAKLYIRNDKSEGPGGGDLLISAVGGEHCEIDTQGVENLRVLRSGSGPVIRWSGGPLRVSVPASVAELFAYTLGGDGEIAELACPVRLKSMGGDLRLSRLGARFKVKTMGGNIRIQLGSNIGEDCKAQTMGGNIRLDVPEGAGATEAELVTLGGSISVDRELGGYERGVNLGKQRLKLSLGEEGAVGRLELKTLGGNIEIRRVDHER